MSTAKRDKVDRTDETDSLSLRGMCMHLCVSALTEGEYMCLILIKGSSFSFVE